MHDNGMIINVAWIACRHLTLFNTDLPYIIKSIYCFADPKINNQQ
jgi:hypothetical protein